MGIPCNFCSFEDMKRRYTEKGKSLVTLPSKGQLGGVDVFAVSDGEEPNKNPAYGNWVCWFMSLPSKCSC
jgi:hypothetical protein